MTENPLISIVVPVYKVEKLLDRCVESLAGQSYENIEIILVDDGSPDACPAMCDAWAQRDGRIRVIHKPNGGPADAKNRGIEQARGEYISFVDSDDYVSRDYLEYLLELLKEHNADIACGGWRYVKDEPADFSIQPEEKVRCLDRAAACRAYVEGQELYMNMVTLWGKLFPAATVKANPIPAGRRIDDEAVIYKYYHQNEKTVLGSREIYGYYQNTGSITHNRNRLTQEHTILALEERCEYFRAAGDNELCAYTAERVLIALVYMAGQGQSAARGYIRSKQGEKFLEMGVGFKYRLFYRVYELLGIDLNDMLLRLKGK